MVEKFDLPGNELGSTKKVVMMEDGSIMDQDTEVVALPPREQQYNNYVGRTGDLPVHVYFYCPELDMCLMVRDYSGESISTRMEKPPMKFLCMNPELVEWDAEVNGTIKNGPVNEDTSILVHRVYQAVVVGRDTRPLESVTILVSKENLLKIAEQLEEQARFTAGGRVSVELPGKLISMIHDRVYNEVDDWEQISTDDFSYQETDLGKEYSYENDTKEDYYDFDRMSDFPKTDRKDDYIDNDSFKKEDYSSDYRKNSVPYFYPKYDAKKPNGYWEEKFENDLKHQHYGGYRDYSDNHPYEEPDFSHNDFFDSFDINIDKSDPDEFDSGDGPKTR